MAEILTVTYNLKKGDRFRYIYNGLPEDIYVVTRMHPTMTLATRENQGDTRFPKSVAILPEDSVLIQVDP